MSGGNHPHGDCADCRSTDAALAASAEELARVKIEWAEKLSRETDKLVEARRERDEAMAQVEPFEMLADQWKARAESAERELASLAAAEEALRPFAALIFDNVLGPQRPDEQRFILHETKRPDSLDYDFTVGDFRRAAAVLAKPGEKPSAPAPWDRSRDPCPTCAQPPMPPGPPNPPRAQGGCVHNGFDVPGSRGRYACAECRAKWCPTCERDRPSATAGTCERCGGTGKVDYYCSCDDEGCGGTVACPDCAPRKP